MLPQTTTEGVANLYPQAELHSSAARADSQYVFVSDISKPADATPHPDPAVASIHNPPSKGDVDSSNQPTQARKGPPLIVKLGVASLGISTLFYVMLFIYLGASSNQLAYTQNLNIAVGIFDEGQLGLAFKAFASQVPAGNGLPSLQVLTGSTFFAWIITSLIQIIPS
jgi:hypothetical protein